MRVCEHLGEGGRGGRGEGRFNVLPWYRLVGVASTSSETQGGKTGLPARVSGHHVERRRGIIVNIQEVGRQLTPTLGSRVW